MDADREAEAVAVVIDRLAEKFPRLGRNEVERAVREAHQALDGNPIREYIPVLVEHDARQELRQITTGRPAELTMA
ncbi:three-helix bundle dimerization domain-containing protein [Lacisediminihabitans sp.]|uniref:three-helix bundle dimerization domain-containing protein n=1 Tax=Lacisediminihabitans sp. TaxID=2787631 RepID=UPI00374D4B8F